LTGTERKKNPILHRLGTQLFYDGLPKLKGKDKKKEKKNFINYNWIQFEEVKNYNDFECSLFGQSEEQQTNQRIFPNPKYT
jgi:hypothetical protein